jgi:hypothetical protein
LLQISQALNVFLHSFPLGIGNENNPIYASQDKVTGGIVEHLAGYNRSLVQQEAVPASGRGPTKIQFWDDFADAVKSCQGPASAPWRSEVKRNGACTFTPNL